MQVYFGSLCAIGMLILSAGSPAHAQGGTQESSLMDARSIKLPSATMYYRLFKPKNYDATKRYPIVVCLHGIGERGSDNKAQVDREDLAHPWIEDSIQARVPHFVMVPQCPSALTWGGMSGGTGGISETGKGILDALDSLKKEFSLDTNRFYITGLSLGGAGTYHLLQMKPNYWAAGVPCSAGGDTSAIETIAKTPFWHHQGSLDGGGAPGRRSALALENHHYKVVRMVSQAVITSPSLSAYRDALKTRKAEELIFNNPTAPVTYDSLKHAVELGVPYLYSELTGGDHRSGWMIAWHNPLLAKWLFSKVRGGNSVSLSPKAAAARPSRNASLIFGALPGDPGGKIFSVQGQRLEAGAWVARPGAHGPLLLVQPMR